MKGAIMASGGGGTKLFAAIGVKYPAGSTVTCTNGAKTLKAKTTSGQWVFAIPEAGPWTVTATDGTETASKTVEITAEGQLESVELSYSLWLYKDGIIETRVSGGLSAKKIAGSDGTYDLTNDGSVLKASADHTYGQYAIVVAYSTENKISLTNYSAIEIIVKSTVNTYSDWPAKVGVHTTIESEKGNGSINAKYTASATIDADLTSQKTFTVDIDSLEGEYYVLFDLCSGGSGPAEASIVSWRLKK